MVEPHTDDRALADLIEQGRLWQAEMERSRDDLTAMNDPTLAQAIVGNTQVAETLKALTDRLEAFHAKPGVVVCPVCKDAATDQQCAVCSGCGHLTVEEAATWLVALQSEHAKPDRDDIERDVRIAIWNAGMKGGMGQNLSQAFIVRAMAEPTMVRALAALQSPPPVVSGEADMRMALGKAMECVGLLSSAIQSGESWTPTCQRVTQEAKDAAYLALTENGGK